MHTPTKHRLSTTIFPIAAILLLALNLRAPFTSVAPVLGWIQSDFRLNTASTGALTSVPLIAFAVFSPFCASIARRFGLERALFGALAAIVAGIALRSSGTPLALYAGTACIGLGGAFGNVLLPGLVKRDFPAAIPSLTGAYSITMGLGGAIGSTLVIPLTRLWGWQIALLALGLMPVLALAAWWPQVNRHGGLPAHAQPAPEKIDIWRNALAWQVTLFMGFNAMLFYIAIAWLPTILMENGLSAEQAGSMHGMLQLASAVPGLILAATLRRMPDQRAAAAGVSLLSGMALLGILLLPRFALAWSALLGFGCGASMMLALTFVGLRTGNANEAAALSGMAQGVGYLCGACGPMALGALRDLSGSWHIPLLAAVAVSVSGAWMGLLAGRTGHLRATLRVHA